MTAKKKLRTVTRSGKAETGGTLSDAQINDLRLDLYKYAKEELQVSEERAMHLARVFSTPVVHI